EQSNNGSEVIWREEERLLRSNILKKASYKQTKSDPLPINRDTPGNDMPQYLGKHCSPLIYTDDTKLLVSEISSNNLAVNFYIALNMAYQYCHENDLVVNTIKSKPLAFGRRQDDTPESMYQLKPIQNSLELP
ncbi:hypothetical protein J6590_098985, partial [Homalodisca vitripennis]